MPGRFYFAPIDPRYAEVGQTLGSAIPEAVDKYRDERDRAEDRKAKQAADARAQQEHEIDLYEQGYGVGPPPVEGIQQAPRRDWAPPSFLRPGGIKGQEEVVDTPMSLFREPPAGGHFADQARPRSASLSPQTPRYEAVGQGDLYRDTQRLAPARQREREDMVWEGDLQDERTRSRTAEAQALEDAEIQELEDEILQAMMQQYPDLAEEQARSYASIAARDRNLAQDVRSYGDPRPVERFTPEYNAGLEEELKLEARYRAPRASGSGGSGGEIPGPGTIEYDRISKRLEAIYGIVDRTGRVTGSHLDPQSLHNLTMNILADPTTEIPPIPGAEDEIGGALGAPPPAGPARPGILSRVRDWISRYTPAGRSDSGGNQGEAGRPRGMPAPGSVEEGRELVSEFPGIAPDVIRTILAEEGYDVEVINEILQER